MNAASYEERYFCPPEKMKHAYQWLNFLLDYDYPSKFPFYDNQYAASIPIVDDTKLTASSLRLEATKKLRLLKHIFSKMKKALKLANPIG